VETTVVDIKDVREKMDLQNNTQQVADISAVNEEHHVFFEREIIGNREEIAELKQQICRLQILLQDHMQEGMATYQTHMHRKESARNDKLKEELTKLVHDQVLKTRIMDRSD
jgi:hypothetical protein